MDIFSLDKNKFIFFPGLLITMLGNVIFSFATGLFLLEVTGKSSIFATNLILASLPLAIASPFLGIVVDFISKKLLIIVADLLNALLMLFIFILWDKIDHIYLIYFGTVLNSFLTFFVFLAYDAGKPQLFPKEWLIKANTISTIVSSLCRILGPLIGGIVYSFTDIKYFILINSISFFISMILECFLCFSKKEKKKRGKIKILEGYYFIKGSKQLRAIIFIGLMINIGFGLSILIPVPYLINNIFDLGKETYRLIMSFSSFGMIVGAVAVNKAKKEFQIKDFSKISYILAALSCIFLIPIIFSFSKLFIIVLFSTGMFLFGAVIAYIDIPIITFLQNYSPENLRGQIMGFFISLVKIVLPLSLFISGKIVDVLSPIISIGFGGLVFALTGFLIIYFYSEVEKNKKTRQI